MSFWSWHTDLTQFLVKISAWFFYVTINRIILKFKGKRVRINSNNFYKENKAGGSTQFPGSCDCTIQGYAILTHTDTHISGRTQSPGVEPHKYVSWALRYKSSSTEENSLFHKWCWASGYPQQYKNKQTKETQEGQARTKALVFLWEESVERAERPGAWLLCPGSQAGTCTGCPWMSPATLNNFLICLPL